jgi:hypothetical protein
MARKNPLDQKQIREALTPKAPKVVVEKDYGNGYHSPWTKGNMEVRRLKDMNKG